MGPSTQQRCAFMFSAACFLHTSYASQCKDVNGGGDHSAWTYLRNIEGQRIEVSDQSHSITNSTFTIGICTDAIQTGNLSRESAGVVEHTQDNATIVVGRYNESRVISGSHWILLTYLNGDPYEMGICNNSSRQAAIMFICNHDVGKLSVAKIIDENLNRQKDCYHLFEVEHCLACISDGCDAYFHHLSPGSVILIVFFSVAGSYLLLGWIYTRCVAKETGWRQIPNALFWQEIGHLQAEGCMLVCKCGTRPEDDYYRVAGTSDAHIPEHSSSLMSDDEFMLPP